VTTRGVEVMQTLERAAAGVSERGGWNGGQVGAPETVFGDVDGRHCAGESWDGDARYCRLRRGATCLLSCDDLRLQMGLVNSRCRTTRSLRMYGLE
jgi:hypothetical protein